MAFLPRRERRRTLRRAAVEYANRGWFVVPGTHIVRDGRSRGRHARTHRDARPLRCSCKLPICPAPGEHPAAPDWQVQATYDPEAVAWWWSGRDVPNVVLPTGWSFDVLHTPSGLGIRVLGRLRDAQLPIPVGPVSRAVSGDWWFFVEPALDTDQHWLDRLAVLGVRHLGPGGFVLAPPSTGGAAGGVGWVVSPSEAAERLPSVEQFTGLAMGVSPRFGPDSPDARELHAGEYGDYTDHGDYRDRREYGGRGEYRDGREYGDRGDYGDTGEHRGTGEHRDPGGYRDGRGYGDRGDYGDRGGYGGTGEYDRGGYDDRWYGSDPGDRR